MRKEIIEFNKGLRADKKMDFQSGDVVKVYLRIKEGSKERIQMFEGLVIAVKGRQSSAPTLTVRKVSHGVGVEMIVPVLSKNVDRIELVKKAKVRRAKLYYIRSLTAKQSRMKYRDIKDFIKKEESSSEEVIESPKEEVAVELPKEEVKAEKVEEKAEKA